MKFFLFAVLLLVGVIATMAAEPKESLKPAEQFYYASPYAYSAYGAYGAAYPAAVGYGAYGYYGR